MCRYCACSTETKHPVLTRPISNPQNPFSAPKFWSPGDGTCKFEVLDCQAGVTPVAPTVGKGNCTSTARGPNAGVRGVLTAPTPEGPWRPWSIPFEGSNDNGIRALANGTLFMYSLADARVLSGGTNTPHPRPTHWPNTCNGLRLHRAEDISSPFVEVGAGRRLTATSWCSAEGPDFWVDQRGGFHALLEANAKNDSKRASGWPGGPRPTPQILPGNTTTAGPCPAAAPSPGLCQSRTLNAIGRPHAIAAVGTG